MKINYVLVDYENVQPKNIALLAETHFRVKIFIGANQTKLPVELVTAMQGLGERAEYIQISGNGSNALDFHIAYYIGRLVETEPAAFFHIISKDTGFDPLIAHLKSKGVLSKRSNALNDIPVLRPLLEASKDEQVDAVVSKLKGMPKSRPQRDKTLRTMISVWFGEKLNESDLERIITELLKRKFIRLDGVKVQYALPD